MIIWDTVQGTKGSVREGVIISQFPPQTTTETIQSVDLLCKCSNLCEPYRYMMYTVQLRF